MRIGGVGGEQSLTTTTTTMTITPGNNIIITAMVQRQHYSTDGGHVFCGRGIVEFNEIVH